MKLEGRHLRGIYSRGESFRERGAFSGAERLVALEEGVFCWAEKGYFQRLAAAERGTFLLRSSRPAAGGVVWAAIRDFLRGYGAFSGAGVSFWRGGEIFLRGLLSLRKEKPDERRGEQGTGEWERH